MYKRYFKRKLDIVLSVLLIILTFPIMLIVGLVIKMFDNGPILFVQKRTGLNGKEFDIYKFRTMSVKTHDKNNVELIHGQRITKIGKVLRKTSIDELPQLFNILKGEMSFIGPRPWIPKYYKSFNKRQKQRVNELPGITGLAQAKGRNGIGILEKIEYDIEYVNDISFKRDVKVFLMTIYIVLVRRGAEIVQESIKDEISVLQVSNGFEENIELEKVQ